MSKRNLKELIRLVVKEKLVMEFSAISGGGAGLSPSGQVSATSAGGGKSDKDILWAEAATEDVKDDPKNPFKVGDNVLYGKYKNKKGKISGFGKNEKGQVTVKITPEKGSKKSEEVGLYKIWTEKKKSN